MFRWFFDIWHARQRQIDLKVLSFGRRLDISELTVKNLV